MNNDFEGIVIIFLIFFEQYGMISKKEKIQEYINNNCINVIFLTLDFTCLLIDKMVHRNLKKLILKLNFEIRYTPSLIKRINHKLTQFEKIIKEVINP